MARIAGVNLPLNKRVEIGLTYVHGVGRSTANQVLTKVGVDPDTYVKDLTEEEQVKLRNEVDSSRGLRHRRGLPTRGQRTKTNARSRKGPRRASVAGKRKPPAKK